MAKKSQALHELRTDSPLRTALLFALFAFVFTFLIFGVFARSMQDQISRDFNAKVKQQATALKINVEKTTENYHQLLYSAASLFSVKAQPTREDWRMMYDTSRIATTYPELLGLGYAPVVSRSDIGTFENEVRATGVENYTVNPPADRATATPILYTEPSQADNIAVYGFDMSSDPIRRAAMEQARDNGEPVMTAPVHLAQDRQKNTDQTGVLIYYPIYASTQAPSTLEERRASIKGYVYIVLHPSDLVKRYLANNAGDYSNTTISVKDITDDAHVSSVYTFTPKNPQGGSKVTDTETSTVSGRTWNIVTNESNSVVQRLSPFVVFGLGTIVSLLLSWAVYHSIIGRMRRIANAYQGEVQKTKDELLALASHQLRTPASGVKQYIGMLTAGLFGELNTEQQSIAQKAYEANERQLEIINELLYVSKADAGQLVIEPKKFDMTRLVQRSADNLAEQAAHKNITLSLRTKREHNLVGDDRYIAMVTDNLISNAIKYSYPSSTVTMSVTSTADMVKFTIRDHGVGVADEDKERIFGKFNRADNPLSHSEGGSGLGLFLARQLARAHGGDITLESVLEKGSTFTLSLPKQLTINESIVNLDHMKPSKEES